MTSSLSPEVKAHLFHQMSWNEISVPFLEQLIALAQQEDLCGAGLATPPEKSGDRSTLSLSLGNKKGNAQLVSREKMVVCGLYLIPFILNACGPECSFQRHVHEGSCVEANTVLGVISGPSCTLLSAERILLNFIQKLSGIATETARFVGALQNSHTRLVDTRKTTPGFRVLEKYAVACGGGWNHRIGLFDRIMLKDNHFAAMGITFDKSISSMIENIRQQNPDLPIQIEIDSINQLKYVMDSGAHVILLDNFSDAELQQAVDVIGGNFFVEASGGIHFERLHFLSNLNLDFISSGSITHQSTWKDIGLDWI